MRNKKDLLDKFKEENNFRNKEAQERIEKFKDDIDSYIEKKLMESLSLYLNGEILFKEIYTLLKDKGAENINEGDITIFFKNRKNEFKKQGYVVSFNDKAMLIYWKKSYFILDNLLAISEKNINPIIILPIVIILIIFMFFILT